MDSRYDFDKETDRDFLREAGKLLQERVINLEVEVIQLKLQQAQNEEIKSKLTGELLVLRRLIFDKKQEKKKKLEELKRKKRKKKINLLHNQNENKNEIEKDISPELKLLNDEIEHDIEDSNCKCCSQGELEELGGLFEESTEFDVNHTYYILKRHKRKKYKCKSCKKIVTAEGPEKLKPGAQFSIQLAVKIACDKFEHHMPLERQRIIMKRQGLDVSVKTLFSLTEHLYSLIFSLHALNREDIIQGNHVNMDESPMCFYNPNKSQGYVWSLSNNRGAYYQFEPSRSQEIAREMIHGFLGVVVTDAFSAYDFLANLVGIIHAYCWSHVRRYFFDAMMENELAGIVVDYIDELYEIEHLALNFDDLKYLRLTRSTDIYKKIEKWVDENESAYLDSTLTGKAIQYFYNQKKGLTHFLTNEKVPLDRVEKWRSIFQVCVYSRKRRVPLINLFPLTSLQTGLVAFPHPAFDQFLTTSLSTCQLAA